MIYFAVFCTELQNRKSSQHKVYMDFVLNWNRHKCALWDCFEQMFDHLLLKYFQVLIKKKVQAIDYCFLQSSHLKAKC